MIKNKFKLFILLLLMPMLSYCGGLRDALEGNKRSEQNDEFLVKKKNPLKMPPDINKLPIPGEEIEINNTEDQDEIKKLLEITNGENSEETNGNSDLLNNMKKKIQ
tara:strand:+ start:1127 stop:1444 length:318 start_codon:yes stop_codon:yes gene_type:complete